MTRGGNQGIQGTNINITADALAVGDRARATSTRISAETARQAALTIEDLRAALAELQLDRDARANVSASVEELATAVADPKVEPSRVGTLLGRLAGVLGAAGVVTSKVVTIAEPLAKLAKLFGLSLPALG